MGVMTDCDLWQLLFIKNAWQYAKAWVFYRTGMWRYSLLVFQKNSKEEDMVGIAKEQRNNASTQLKRTALTVWLIWY